MHSHYCMCWRKEEGEEGEEGGGGGEKKEEGQEEEGPRRLVPGVLNTVYSQCVSFSYLRCLHFVCLPPTW